MIIISCKKENLNFAINIQPSFSDSAIQFLKAKLSDSDYKTLNIKTFTVLRLRNENIGIKIFEKGKSADNFIILKKDISYY